MDFQIIWYKVQDGGKKFCRFLAGACIFEKLAPTIFVLCFLLMIFVSTYASSDPYKAC